MAEWLAQASQWHECTVMQFDESTKTQEIQNNVHFHLFQFQDNEYIEAIKTIGGLLSHYDISQEFTVYGFGAKFGRKAKTKHCFSVSESPVQGIQVRYNTALSISKSPVQGIKVRYNTASPLVNHQYTRPSGEILHCYSISESPVQGIQVRYNTASPLVNHQYTRPSGEI